MGAGDPLRPLHESAGARFAEVDGLELPRNYGDPQAEYEAARGGAGLVDRADRIPVRMFGRDPLKMMQGLITNDLAGAPDGQGRYAGLLTPKGRMVADLRVFRRAAGELLLDLDARALEGAFDHLKKFVPPLFARFEDRSDDLRVLGVYGPEAREAIADVLDPLPAPDAPEEAFTVAPFDGADALIVRSGYTGDDGYDVFIAAAQAEPLWRALTEAGVRPVGHGTLEVLRIEAGRPRWAAELDDRVFPIEAGLRERMISETKGCYTGQEVIIRILHRGRVNWHLRGLLLGDSPAPAPDTPLMRTHESKRVARITSACSSPRWGQTIALGYVRREIEPPATLRLGDPVGPEARVVRLPFEEPDADG